MAQRKTNSSAFITRFAPSPTGRLHKGHAFSALLAYKAATEMDGTFLLRIEDIDTTRCKPEFTEAIFEDLRWLGLSWEEPVRIQSQHFGDYANALETLKERGLVYPCFCTRKEIQAEIAASKSAPHGPDGPLYPGTCRRLSNEEREQLIAAGKPHAWRLDLAAALEEIGDPLEWQDAHKGSVTATPEELGDVILARKDTPTSYHLSVVVDDALQGITHVVRGLDLYHATHIHVVLQKLLDLPTPTYQHHELLLDDQGERFAKRNKSVTLQQMRTDGLSASELKKELLSA